MLPLGMNRPWIRFLVLGALLFFGDRARTAMLPMTGAFDLPSGVAMDDGELLFRVALSKGMAESDLIVRRRLAQNMRFALDLPDASESDLVSQALALGLHESDLVVRRRLVQKMILLLEAPAEAREPDDEELRAWRRKHGRRWHRPARRDLTQVFFQDQSAARDAALRPGASDSASETLGDDLPLPRQLLRQGARDLERLFGRDFARAVFDAPIGHWSQPIPSPYGWHRVFVHSQQDGAPLRLDDIRAEIRGHWMAAERARMRTAGIAALRERWSVPSP